MPRELIRSKQLVDVETGKPASGYDVKVGWGPDRYVQLGVETNDDRPLMRMLCESQVELLGAIVKHLATEHGPVDDGQKGRPWSDDAVVGEALLALMGDGATLPPPEDGLTGPPTAAFAWRGLWSELDRDGCNRLIRVLRRARDTAYGKDE